MNITGNPMKEWIMVEPEGVEDDSAVNERVQRAIRFVKTLPKN